MKKLSTLLLLCILIGTSGFSQETPNFYQTKQTLDVYYNDLINIYGIENMKGRDYNPYQRWKNYWEPVLYPHGDFSIERQNLENYLNDYLNGSFPQYSAPFTLDWSLVGPSKMPDGNDTESKGLGQIHYITFDPNDPSHQKMFACSPAGGLWKTIDGGDNWVNAGTDQGLALCGVSSVAIDPNNSESNWFVSTGNGEPMPGGFWAQNAVGVWRTTTGGSSWDMIGLENVHQMRKIILTRYQGNLHLFVATTNGVYECENGLSSNPSWSQLVSGNFYDIEFDPQNIGILYASGTGTNSSIYKLDWANNIYSELPNLSGIPLDDDRRLSIEISEAAPQYLFIVSTYDNAVVNTSYLFRYELNTSSLFEKGELPKADLNQPGVGPERAMGWTLSTVLDNGQLNMVYGNTAPIRKTNDLLNNNPNCSWTNVTSSYFSCEIHVDMHYMVFEPDGLALWVANDGGVYKSTMPDLINNWEEKNNGLAVATIHNMAISDHNKGIALSGAYDNGSYLYTKNNEIWGEEHIVGGDGFQCLIDWNNPDRMLASAQYSIYRSLDGGESFAWTNGGFHWHTFFDQNKTNPDVLYGTNSQGVKSSTNFGGAWTNIANYPGVSNNQTYKLAVSPTNGNYIYTSWYGNTSGSPQKVFKSSTGGGTSSGDWEDVGSPVVNGWVSSIAVDYFNPNHIWVAINSKVYDVNTITHEWSDISSGLPSYISVKHIEQLNDTEVKLFAGTNYGLYYYNETDQNWQFVGGNLPNVTVSDIQLDLENNRIAVGTFGRGVWEAQLPCYTESADLIIDSDETWTFDRRISGNIIVEAGNTLTIDNAKIQLANNVKIIVKPFAKFIINGGKLTNVCNDQKWSGIEVWGHYDDDQDANNGNYIQGYLELNNCFIENAEIAVYLGRPQYYEWNGGILKAENVTFKNNRIAVFFPEYHYRKSFPEGIIELNNISYVRYCSFNNDENYIEDSDFESHIKLESVKGISIKQSTFISGGRLGKGIDALDAGFSVSGNCNNSIGCTPEEWEYSSFTGYNMAIHTRHVTGPLYSINIYHSIFDDNQYGVYANQLEHVTNIRNSYFYVGKNTNSKEKDLCSAAYGRGIHISNSNNFHIEYNKFFLADGVSISDNVIGIYAAHNPSEYDVIYSNEFTGFKLANLAYETNRETPGYDDNGLVYECNENTDNFIDFEISGYDHDLAKIHGHQGTEFISARNKYSSNTDPNAKHWRNMGVEMINYYVHSTENNTDYKPTKIDTYNNGNLFTIVSATSVNQCPDNDGLQIERTTLNPEEFQVEELSYSEAYSNYQAVETIFNDLKDGGSTEGTSLTIASAQPDDTWELRDNLLGKSPHLSKLVLMEAADKTDVLPNSVLLDILAANPDELRKADLIVYLENKEEPLPDYMIDILEEVSSGTTYKTALINQMNRYKSKQKKAVNTILNSLLNEEYQDFNLIRNWLDNLGGINADMKIVKTYIQEENYTDAATLLNLIPDLYDLQGDALDLFNDDKDVLQLQITLKQSDRSLKELTSVEIAQLEIWASNNIGYARNFARIVLETHYSNDTFCDCINRIENKSSVADFVFEEEKDNPLFICASPNPAKHYVEFSYELSEIDNEGLIIITDIYGKQIHSISVNSQKGLKIWDIRKISTGSYIFTLKTKSFEQSGKLIIQ